MGVKLQLRSKLLSFGASNGKHFYNSATGESRYTQPSGGLTILYIVEAVIDDGSYSIDKRSGTIEFRQSGRWYNDPLDQYDSNTRGPYTYNFESAFNEMKLTDGVITVELFRVVQEYNLLNVPQMLNGVYGIWGNAEFGTITTTVTYSTGTSSGDLTTTDYLNVLSTVDPNHQLPERGSAVKASHGMLGAPQSVTVHKPASRYFKVKYSCTGNGTETTGWIFGDPNNYASVDGVESIYEEISAESEWTPPLTLASHSPTTNRVDVTFTTYTYDDDHNLKYIDYDTRIYLLPDEYGPTCEILVDDAQGYYEKYGAFIAGKSKYLVNINAQGVYGSRIDKFHTVANGEIYTYDLFTTNTITNTGDLEVITTVKDSRGRTTTDREITPVISYSVPNVSDISAVRCNSDGSVNKDGTHMKVTFSATVSPLNNLNECIYLVKYKKTSEGDDKYVVDTLMDYSANNTYNVTDAVHIFPAESGVTYNVVVEITDDFSTRYRTTIGSSGSKILSFLNKGAGLAIGKLAELVDHLDIGWITRFRKPVILDNSKAISGESADGTYQIGMLYLDTNDSTTLSGDKININASEGVYINGQLVSKTNGSPNVSTLWTGQWFMKESQTATLSEPISEQLHGIVLVWSYYSDSVTQDVDFQTTYIPKDIIALKTSVETSVLLKSVSQGYMGSKRLIISDTQIAGHTHNDNAAAESVAGYTDSPQKFVLRYVIGV